GGHRGQDSTDAPGGSQVFPGFATGYKSNSSRTNVGGYLDLESNLNPQLLGNVAGRFEHYSDFGSLLTGKVALRYQPSHRVTLRAAGSTGFRAPGLAQIHFHKVVTNVISGNFVDVGVFDVNDLAAKLLGAKPLKEEKSVNLSGGIAITPRDNLTITTDVFHIKITNRILLRSTLDHSFMLTFLDRPGLSSIWV